MVKVGVGGLRIEVDMVGILALVVAVFGVVLYRRPIGELMSACAERIRGHP